jgi:hypothetical protein
MSSAARGSPRPKSKARAGSKPRAALKRLPGQVPGAGTVLHGPVNKAGVLQGGTRVRKAGSDEPMNPNKLVTDKRARSPATANKRALSTAVAAVANNPPQFAVGSAREEADALDPGGFVAAEKFDGMRPGFSFMTGWQGTGYYRDRTSWLLKQEHMARVEGLKREHKQKVDSLMRSIHKLQDKTKDLRRADKENRRSKLIIDLQNTVGEQEAVIRAMIRSLTASGYTDQQFAELFNGKKKLRDVDAIETGLRHAEREKESAEKKLKKLEAQYEQSNRTREQLESDFEAEITVWKAQALGAEELNQQLDAAFAEKEGSRAREQEATAAMDHMKDELQKLRVDAKTWEEQAAKNDKLLEQYQAVRYHYHPSCLLLLLLLLLHLLLLRLVLFRFVRVCHLGCG